MIGIQTQYGRIKFSNITLIYFFNKKLPSSKKGKFSGIFTEAVLSFHQTKQNEKILPAYVGKLVYCLLVFSNFDV